MDINMNSLMQEIPRAHHSLLICARLLVCAIVFLAVSCDLEGKRDCAWTLEPESTLRDKVEPGFIPVCARNRVTQKQDCRLQTTLSFAKKVLGRKFRYVDLKIKSVALPRTIKTITFCDHTN